MLNTTVVHGLYKKGYLLQKKHRACVIGAFSAVISVCKQWSTLFIEVAPREACLSVKLIEAFDKKIHPDKSDAICRTRIEIDDVSYILIVYLGPT